MFEYNRCFAYGGPGKCLALKKMECQNCSFGKTENKLTRERKSADFRLKQIGKENWTGGNYQKGT